MARHKHPDVTPATVVELVDRLARFDALVEVGIGLRPEVAVHLSDHAAVTATDIVPRPVPEGVRFVQDDITRPDPEVYADADVIYGVNLPPELHPPTQCIANQSDATFAFTTLGTDPPAVPANPEMIPSETLYWARD